jgi:hypothetical protein
MNISISLIATISLSALNEIEFRHPQLGQGFVLGKLLGTTRVCELIPFKNGIFLLLRRNLHKYVEWFLKYSNICTEVSFSKGLKFLCSISI